MKIPLLTMTLAGLLLTAACGNEESSEAPKEPTKTEQTQTETETKAPANAEQTQAKPVEQKKSAKKEESYTKLLSVKRNFSQSCFDYEYSKEKTDYLTFDFKEDTDENGYHWDSQKVTVETKEGKKPESVLTSDDDISFKYVDSDEFTITIKYNSIRGSEKYQKFTVKKKDIAVSKKFDVSQCKEKEKGDIPDVDVDIDEDSPDVDAPGTCGPGRHYVKGYYRNGNYVEGHCRRN
ncbi:hypothetical protein [Bacillus gobiensis]|uniref:Lipoprotein n=1 Tax=Bacillus gobiensis TaxID=1441095 RepID=A0A0M4FTM5_9BACI|nr:hypothetical protein [Bacillus gobiensis]ALC81555.1 hypothetical protein AM592_08045 [Bacillus gobiensis]